MSTPFRLLLPRLLHEEMVAHALADLPNECCGLLAGRLDESSRIARVCRRHALINAAGSPIEYVAEAGSLCAANREARQAGLEILAFYHSHPTSEPIPSRKDLERNFWGMYVIHFILSLTEREPKMRGWWLGETDFREAEWEVIE